MAEMGGIWVVLKCLKPICSSKMWRKNQSVYHQSIGRSHSEKPAPLAQSDCLRGHPTFALDSDLANCFWQRNCRRIWVELCWICCWILIHKLCYVFLMAVSFLPWFCQFSWSMVSIHCTKPIWPDEDRYRLGFVTKHNSDKLLGVTLRQGKRVVKQVDFIERDASEASLGKGCFGEFIAGSLLLGPWSISIIRMWYIICNT